MKLKDRVAVITGGSQGLGREFARRLAEDGARVVIADINNDKGEQVEKEFIDNGFSAKFIQVDVSNKESVFRMVDETVKQFGGVDILINNAAIFSTIKLKPFEELSLEEWNSVINVNLTGAFLCCQAVVPEMRKRKSGRIINISSNTILSGKAFYIHYVASKSGIVGVSRALAREVGNDNITVNTVAPGATVTEIQRETVTKEQAELNMHQQCIKRKEVPGDLVGTVAFLCSDEASFITGQLIAIDGGKSMH